MASTFEERSAIFAKALEQMQKPCPDFIDKAILKKQTPKKPDHINNGFKNSEDRWRCPCCNMLIMAMYRGSYTHGHQADYCEWCGQRIDWSDVEDGHD